MTRVLLFAAAFLSLWATEARAQDFYNRCPRHPDVNIRVTPGDFNGVAEAVNPESKADTPYRAEIRVNPKSAFGYLSNQTLRWLFVRECYYAVEETSVQDRKRPRVAGDADCEALRWLFENGEFSERDVQIVERDLRQLLGNEDGRDWDLLLGPRRSPRLLKCL